MIHRKDLVLLHFFSLGEFSRQNDDSFKVWDDFVLGFATLITLHSHES